MKKVFVLALLLYSVIFTACAYNAGGSLVNAENYSGLAFAEPHTPMNEPLDAPPITASDEPTLSEITDISGETTPDSGDSGETTPFAPEITEATEATATAPASATVATAAPPTSEQTAAPTAPPPPPVINPSFYKTLNYGEVKGVWLSYIELSGILTGKSEAVFRKNFADMMDNCLSIGINTVYVHLRPFGDALYESDYFPWSKYVTGKIGAAPSFDPLAVMLDEAHKRGISFQGWLNPMRINADADISKISADYAVGRWYADPNQNGKYIVKCGDYWYLNPAYDECIELISRGASEICAKYNVDGIHIDDYFYPVTDASFDAAAYKASGFSSVSGFRTYNCSAMVKSLYAAVKKGNPNALFGISPQGSIENNYNMLYADVEKWCRNEGFCDYVAPQFYYGFDNSSQPYKKCVAEWQEMVNYSGVKLITGLAVYKIGKEDIWAGNGKDEWLTEKQIIKRQIQEARSLKNYGGVIFYSYSYLFGADKITPAISDEIAAFKEIL